MHFLIDGYNFLFCLSESKRPLQSQRQNIIHALQKEFSFLHLEGTLAFDGSHRRGEQSGLAYHSPLIIAYSSSGETADQLILEKLEIAKTPSQITVVTDDRSLASQARQWGARTLSNHAFLAKLEEKHAKKRKARKKNHEQQLFKESERELNRLLKIFEERLDKTED